MPLDLTDLGLDDSVIEKINERHEADIVGLKSKNAELVERVTDARAAKDALEKQKVEAIQAAEDQKVALAEKEGDIEKYKNAIAERDQAIETVKREFQEAENARLQTEALGAFGKNLTSDPAGKMYMESLFKEQIQVVDGVVKPKDPTLTIESLTQNLVTDKANANYVRAEAGSGSGATGATGGGAAINLKTMSATEEARFANENPELYARLTNQG